MTAITQVEFDRIDDRTIYFKVPPGSGALSLLKTALHELNHLGVLRPSEGGLPYFLFSGKPCQDCLQDSALYLFRPGLSRPQTFVYPGRILDSKTRAVVLESRGFFGRCLPQRKSDVLVVFQKERIDRRRGLQSSVFVAEAGPERIDEKLLERNFPSLKNTLALVKQKSCREINGRYRVMLRKAFDIRSSNLKEEEDDERDEGETSLESESAALPPPEGARVAPPTPAPNRR